jgi:putative flippase GtrA
MIKPIKGNIGSFIKFTSVAVGSAGVDWIVFALLNLGGVSPLHSQMIARISGGVFSFLINKTWSFNNREKRGLVIEGRRFIILYAVSYVLSISMFYSMTEYLGWSEYVAKLVSDTLIYFFNFTVMNVYVFHMREGATERMRNAWQKVKKREA